MSIIKGLRLQRDGFEEGGTTFSANIGLEIAKGIKSQPGIMSGHVSNILNDTFCGNLAPLLLMTPDGVRRLRGIGKGRALFISEVLAETGYKLRQDNERVHARAKHLFGSVYETPIQALFVVSWLSGSSVVSSYEDSPAVRKILKSTKSMTIGEAYNITRSKEAMKNYFAAYEVEIDDRGIRNCYDELSSRIAPWQSSLQITH